jgi:hypothetical protein
MPLRSLRELRCTASPSRITPCHSFIMSPCLAFRAAALCLTLLTSFIFLFNNTNAPSDTYGNHSLRYGGIGRAPAAPPSDVHPVVHVDEPLDDPIWDIRNRTLGIRPYPFSYMNTYKLLSAISFRRFMPFLCHIELMKEILLH